MKPACAHRIYIKTETTGLIMISVLWTFLIGVQSLAAKTSPVSDRVLTACEFEFSITPPQKKFLPQKMLENLKHMDLTYKSKISAAKCHIKLSLPKWVKRDFLYQFTLLVSKLEWKTIYNYESGYIVN